MNNGYSQPYIPLSWLRRQWKHVRQLHADNTPITVHDIWLFIVRQEIDRLIIEELRKENAELKEEIKQYRGFVADVLMEV